MNASALRAHIASTLLAALSNAHTASASNTLAKGLAATTILILDAALRGTFSLGVDAAALRSAGVERILSLADPDLDSALASSSDRSVFVFVIRPTLAAARRNPTWFSTFAPQQGSDLQHSRVTVLFAPRRSLLCDRVFEDSGVAARASFSELHVDLIPLDDDVLSMDFEETCFKDLFLHKDPSCLHTIAKAIMKVQALHGIIPKIIGKGNHAYALAELLLRLRRELDASAVNSDKNSARESSNGSSPAVFPAKTDIDSLIILDRTVDLVTPLCMQLTYEGLVDEFFGIQTTFVQVNETFISQPTAGASKSSDRTSTNPPKLKKVSLNPASDLLFSQIRDQNFSTVGFALSANARRIQGEIDGRKDAKTISEIKEFIGKIGGLESEKASLKLHMSIAEEINRKINGPDFNRFLQLQQNILSGNVQSLHVDYLEQMIDKKAPILETLRLMCLYSVVCGGMKSKVFDLLRREFVQTYGIEHILTLYNLESTGLFVQALQSSFDPAALLLMPSAVTSSVVPEAWPGHYSAAQKALDLIVDDIDEQKPSDVAYVHSGYAPISVRLIEAATRCGRFANGMAPATAGGTVKGKSVSLGNLVTPPNAEKPQISSSLQSFDALDRASGKLRDKKKESYTSIGWRGCDDALKVVGGGSHFEVDQPLPDPNFVHKSERERKTTVVLFLGGCTTTEVSSLRFLSKNTKERQFVVLTTSTITGPRMLNALVHYMDKNPIELNA
ncbi:hypothetical protein HDU84_007928 [Entophlyctis sp. JEL0112]|nr:hypothetical protein HDU84_007928 [Entophlyctis sp. JEL0112]